MATIPNILLSNGVEIPQLGFGTYKLTENVVPVVRSAIEIGYRHLDTAQMYDNEAEVGQAWSESGLDRTDFFLTSKLDNSNHLRDQALPSFEKTLTDLRTDYVDLFLIHWPMPNEYGGDFASTWRILEEFYAQGRARAIGVSNFEPEHLQVLLDSCAVVPMVNQVESHPYLPNEAVHQFDSAHGIVTEAWSPLARGLMIDDSTLTSIGEKYGKTSAQVALRWAIQRGDVVFPKARSAQRQQQNFDVFDFSLSPAEMEKIRSLDRGEKGRTGSHPAQKGF